jgi:hypothetical protein
MEGLGSKMLLVGVVYLVFIVVYAIFKQRYVQPSMRSRRYRSRTAEAAGFATTQSMKSEKRLAWIRIGTTVLVGLSLLALALVLYYGVQS